MPAIELVKRAKFAIVNHYQITFLVLPTIFFTLATVAVGLRLRVRRMKKASLAIEDYLCVFSLVLGYAMIGHIFFLVYETGEGMPTSFIMQHHPEVLTLWMKITFSIITIWTTSVAAIQISLLFFYLRLFDVVRLTRYACYLIVALIIGWYFSTTIAWFNSCHPFPKIFDASLAGKCSVDQSKVCSATGFMHVGFDLFILLIPIPTVWKLKMSLRKRLMIIGLLGLGVFATICSIIRMHCLMGFWVKDPKTDPFQAAWGPLLFQTLEVAIGIFCCCIPVLPPVFRLWRDQWNTSTLVPTVFKTSSKGSISPNPHHQDWIGNTIGGSKQKFYPLQHVQSVKSKSRPSNTGITAESEI